MKRLKKLQRKVWYEMVDGLKWYNGGANGTITFTDMKELQKDCATLDAILCRKILAAYKD